MGAWVIINAGWYKITSLFNEFVTLNQQITDEFERVSLVVGKERRIEHRVKVSGATGGWKLTLCAINELTDDIVKPTTEVARVIGAVAKGDLTRSIAVEASGEMAALKDNINEMILTEGSDAQERAAGLAQDKPRPLFPYAAGRARSCHHFQPDHVRARAAGERAIRCVLRDQPRTGRYPSRQQVHLSRCLRPEQPRERKLCRRAMICTMTAKTSGTIPSF